MLVAQISDLHVVDADTEIDRVYATAHRVVLAVRHLNSLPRRPDAVILSGDLVDRGSASEYARLKSLLQPLTIPAYLMPGNHDHRDQMRASFPEHTYLPATGTLSYTVEHLPVRFVMLDSWVPGQTHGLLGGEQLAWLDRTLSEQPTRPTVVAVHHPPAATGLKRMDRWNLQDSADFAAVIAKYGQVERVLCGHLHRPITARFAGTVLQSCPSTAHQIALDLSDNERFLDLVMEPPACLLHLWDGQSLVSHTSYIDPFEVRQKLDFAPKM